MGKLKKWNVLCCPRSPHSNERQCQHHTCTNAHTRKHTDNSHMFCIWFFSQQAKILAYMFLVTTRDVETQQKGIVTVHVPEGIHNMSKTPSPLNTRSKQLRFLSYINGAYMSLPFKVCAHHLCLMHKGQRRFSTFERLTLKLVTGMVGECTHRLKIHMGKSNVWSTCLGCYYESSITTRANQNSWYCFSFSGLTIVSLSNI